MKKHMLMSFGIILILILIPAFTYAYGAPLGAQFTTPVTGVVCKNGSAPYMIRSVRGIQGPYTTPTRAIRSGQWVLGTYSPVQNTTNCKTADGKPFPVYLINPNFGLSR